MENEQSWTGLVGKMGKGKGRGGARNLLIGFRDLAAQLVLILYDCSIHNIHPARIKSRITLSFLGAKDHQSKGWSPHTVASATPCRMNGCQGRAAAQNISWKAQVSKKCQGIMGRTDCCSQ
jgi:hypothetical protein